MKNYKNEGVTDRYLRVILAGLLFVLAYFWVGGQTQIILFVLGFVVLFTAVTGFCAVYKVFKISTYRSESTSYLKKGVFLFIFILVLVLGSYYSIFFTKKFFLNDYNRMNNYYKQTLFYAGQNKRVEAVDNYNKLVAEYDIFENKYTNYHPYSIKRDKQFDSDLMKVAEVISSLKENINSGDLNSSHLTLESVRPMFQDILKRNNFSLFAVSLVDFHDVMEKIIEASDSKEPNSVISTYNEVDGKLKEVEAISNDEEIHNIRMRLEELLTLAKDNQKDKLSAKAGELKSAFVKVYLKRG